MFSPTPLSDIYREQIELIELWSNVPLINLLIRPIASSVVEQTVAHATRLAGRIGLVPGTIDRALSRRVAIVTSAIIL